MEPTLLPLLPDTAAFTGGELVLGGLSVTDLVREFGTPLVVYDQLTLLGQARAYREAAPDAHVVYGTKAFPSLAILRLFAEAGLGADVSTAGELEFARRAGIPGERLVVHGNNKEDELLRDATAAGALIVLDSLAELDRARAVGRDPVPDPRHARNRGRHTRGGEDRAPRLEVRFASGGCPRGTRAGRGRRGPACPRRLPAPALRRVADDCRLGGGIRGSRPRRARLDAQDRRPRRWARRPSRARGSPLHGRGVRGRPRRRARPRLATAGAPCSTADPRARPIAGLACRRHPLFGRRRQARERRDDVRDRRRRHVRQPTPRDVRRPLHGPPREPCRRARRGSLRGRRQALRVRRRVDRACRAAGAGAWRRARRAGRPAPTHSR